jgi:subtilisin
MARHTPSRARHRVTKARHAPPRGSAPQYTERYLTLLRNAVPIESFLRTLKVNAGIEGVRASELGDSGNACELANSQAVLYERLGIAMINAQADQIAFARIEGVQAFPALQKERAFRAPPVSAEPTADSESAAHENETTWGLQATRVATCEHIGAGTRVCVLDSGIELNHVDLRPTRTRSFTGVDDVSDRVGHGSHCAGTIAGPRVPSRGPRYGIACDTELFVGKVFDTSADSSDGQMIAGIHWAVENGCDIVAMSFGEPPAETYSAVFEQVARNALLAGTLLIAAAGNDSRRLQRPPLRQPVNHPANCPSILAVGAVDPELDLVISSNAGLRSRGGELDLVAPGANIYSAWKSPGLYARRHGTSMAVPFVAGIAALWAEASGLRGRSLWNLLLQKARALPLAAEDVGHGLVQAP